MKRWWGWVGAATGALLLVAGVGLLTSWELELFRATTFDRDFTGLTCGTPLDNPGWPTGHPCHGAVNRQTGAAWITAMAGVVVIAASLVVLVAPPRSALRSADQ